MPGRPKPTNLKVFEGNRGKRPLPENEPKPRPLMPKCPGYLDRQAKKTWKKLAPICHRIGTLTETDGEAFAELCQIHSRLIACHTFLNKENPSLMQIVEKPLPDGNTTEEIKASPYLIQEKHLQQIFRAYASEFGLSPRGRSGIKVGVDSNDDGANLLR